ncbi:MAG: rhomboid family intramembrane serine protease [Saprospiraceae bacterium]|nr:rhomboid family intramembrane serine protease [Saprospiraceae bacterium]
MIDQNHIISITILALILVFSFLGLNNYKTIELFRHYPYEESRNKSFYRWITCGFVHGNLMHLLLNAFVLWQFGFIVETIFISKFGDGNGRLIYLIIYLAILALTCVPSYYKHKNNSSYASIGASGAISGLLFIYIYFFPMNTLLVYFIPMPAILMGVLYLGYSYWASRNTNDGVDHDAHFYGAILGLIFAILMDKITL